MGDGGADGDTEMLVDAEEAKHHRHPPGTWKIWESSWFYMTQTPGGTDIKIVLKWHLRGAPTGMGTRMLSKTISPHHYGDDLSDPWRSILLLRSWSIWRARLLGWSKQKECRSREVGRQMERFVHDLRKAHSEHGLAVMKPLLGCPAAHDLLYQWTADAVRTVLA